MSVPVSGRDAVRKYELEVGDRGRVELNVPFAPGARVVVYVHQATTVHWTASARLWRS